MPNGALVFGVGLLALILAYCLDVRKLGDRQTMPILRPLSAVLRPKSETIADVAGLLTVYSAFVLFWFAFLAKHNDLLLDIWWAMCAVVVAMDAQTTYIPRLSLVYVAAIGLLLAHFLVDPAGASDRLLIGGAFYAIGVAFVLYGRHIGKPIGGGDAPVMLLFGCGLPTPAHATAFLFFGGLFTVAYGLLNTLPLLVTRLYNVLLQADKSDWATLYVVISSVFADVIVGERRLIPLLPPLCVGAGMSLAFLGT